MSGHFFKADNTNGQQAHKNQNHSKNHFTSIGSGIIRKKMENNQCWLGNGKTGTLTHCWHECKMVQLLWKAVW